MAKAEMNCTRQSLYLKDRYLDHAPDDIQSEYNQ